MIKNLYKDKKIISIHKNRILYNLIIEQIDNDTDPSHRPYISSRYITPTFDMDEEVVLDIYCTDYFQSDLFLEPPIYKDMVLMINLNGVKTIKKDIKTGSSRINIGKLPEGEHWVVMQITDSRGRASHEIYEEFRIIDTIKYQKDIEDNTVIITDDILLQYNIDKNDNPDNALATKQGFQKLMNDYAANGVRKIIIPQGIYQMESEVWIISQVTYYDPANYTQEELDTFLQGNKNTLLVPNNFILDMNGATFKLKESLLWQNYSRLIEIQHGYDSHVINGTFEGDYRRRDLSTSLPNGYPRGEGGSCFAITGNSKYCSFENCNVKLFTGYCCTIMHKGGIAENTIGNYTNININNKGEECYGQNKWTSGYIPISEKFDGQHTITCGSYIGNGWAMQTDTWYVDLHFYDENKNYIKTANGFLYRKVLKPDNAKYVRATVDCAITDSRQDPASYLENMFCLQCYNMPRNCVFDGLHFNDTRTCGLNPNQGNNNLITNCTFIKCATNITPVAVDFEDGWYLMQDYMFSNNVVVEPSGTADMVIDAGMNLMFVNNTNFRFVTQGNYGVGYYFGENKETKRLYLNHNYTTYPFMQLYKNEFYKDAYSWGDSTRVTVSPIIRDHTFIESTGVPLLPNNGYYLNCLFNFNNVQGETQYHNIILPQGKCVNCTMIDAKGWTTARTHYTNCEYINCDILRTLGTVIGAVAFDGCNIDDMSMYYDHRGCQLTIRNCNLKNFHYNYENTWKDAIIDLKLINCTIDNSTSDNGVNIFVGNWGWQTVADKKKFTIENCTLLNGTGIASEDVLSNTNIVWNILNNK
jgi:hypothetical protein